MGRGWLGREWADRAASKIASRASGLVGLDPSVGGFNSKGEAEPRGALRAAAKLSELSALAGRALLSQDRVEELAAVCAYAGLWDALDRWVSRHGARLTPIEAYRSESCPGVKSAPGMALSALRLAVVESGAMGVWRCEQSGANLKDAGALVLATMVETLGRGDGAMEALLMAGADPNERLEWRLDGKPGWGTATHVAALSERSARLALKAGGSATALDHEGLSPLDWAYGAGCVESARLWLAAGAKASVKEAEMDKLWWRGGTRAWVEQRRGEIRALAEAAGVSEAMGEAPPMETRRRSGRL